MAITNRQNLLSLDEVDRPHPQVTILEGRTQ